MDDLLARQDGVVSRRQALRHMSSGAVERRVASGRWQTAHRGVYVTHSGPVGPRERRWVAALAAGSGRVALLGGLSALETLGFRGLAGISDRTGGLHVLVPARLTVRRPPAGVVVHRTTTIDPGDIHQMGSPPGTMPARSLIDAAQWAADDDKARAIVAAAFQQRLVCASDVEPVLDRMQRAHRRALITEAVRDAAAGAHSLPEADLLRLCRRVGLPVPELQHRRRDGTGGMRYLDAYFADWRVHVEVDGGQHTDAWQWWSDMRRQNALWIPGERVLRFPAWVIRHRPDEVAVQLEAALSAAGWRRT
ncbi:MAG TPA: type IV toxin-antitoxin system AbiEi family antitoxin domain-containing protein [Actinoplanes sp.]